MRWLLTPESAKSKEPPENLKVLPDGASRRRGTGTEQRGAINGLLEPASRRRGATSRFGRVSEAWLESEPGAPPRKKTREEQWGGRSKWPGSSQFLPAASPAGPP